MKKHFLILVLFLTTFSLTGQYVDGDKYYGGNQTVLDGYKLSSPRIDADTVVFAGGVVTFAMPDTIVNKRYIDSVFAGDVLSTDSIFYISETGSDITGDGTSINPYATYSRVFSSLPDVLIGMTLTIQNISGTVEFTSVDKGLLSSKSFRDVNVFFTGVMGVIESAIAFTESPAYSMNYTATKAGLTVTENQYLGMYVDDGGGRYLPIPYNTAGTDNFTASYLRALRSGTKNVVNNVSTMDVSSQGIDILSFNIPGINKITFNSLIINAGVNDMDFSQLVNNIEFDFGTKINCDQIYFGLFNDPSVKSAGFTGAVIQGSAANEILTTRSSTTNLNLTRTLIQGSNVAGLTGVVLSADKNSIVRMRECAIISNSGLAVRAANMGNVELSKTNIVKDCAGFLGIRYGNGTVATSTTEGWALVNMMNTPYIMGYYEPNTTVIISDLLTDGNYIGVTNDDASNSLINLDKNIHIFVDGATPTLTYNGTGIDTIMGGVIPNETRVEELISQLATSYTFQDGLSELNGTVSLGGYSNSSIVIGGDGATTDFEIGQGGGAHMNTLRMEANNAEIFSYGNNDITGGSRVRVSVGSNVTDFTTEATSFGGSSILTPVSSSSPTTPSLGTIYTNSSDNHIYFYNGTTWVQLD